MLSFESFMFSSLQHDVILVVNSLLQSNRENKTLKFPRSQFVILSETMVSEVGL